MRLSLVGKRLQAGALAALLALQPVGAPALRLSAAVSPALSISVTMAPSDASAKASSSRSSGGYSRPSSSSFSSSSRTPSTSSGGYSRPSDSTRRTPSTSTYSAPGASSGGYARPGSAAPSTAAPPTSAGDRALSQQRSSETLGRYREQQQAQRAPAAPPATAQPPAAPRAPSTGSSDSSWNWGWGSGSYRTPSPQPPRPPYPDAYRGYGWAPPPYAYTAPRSFGVWDGLFLWFMLDTLTRPGHAAFFHDHADDPGYREWRAEAERQSRDNAELRAKLDRLDAELAAQAAAPRDPGRLPSDVPADLARADSAKAADAPPTKASFGFVLWAVLLLGVAVLFLLWRARRRLQAPSTQTAGKAAGKAKDTVPLFGTLGNYVNQKLSGKRYTPSLFRVGMAVTIDPAPFLLAEGTTKVKAPATGTDQLASVDAVGTVTAGSATVHRLYLPDGGFFQLHLTADGQPDECRYFTVIDTIMPADEGEWGFWLDDAQGMIGWPEFQTRDGKAYARAWSPGPARIPPFTLAESVETVRGTTTGTSRAMLYAAATGAAAPAPDREYILVAAVEQGGQAWIQVAAGIDVNPASLSLS